MTLEVNPQPVKYALSLMRKCRAALRLPLIEPQQETKEKIEEAMKAAGLLDQFAHQQD
jgi:4-hydroxy-tetrahydrodipicolinate synthase